MVADVPSQPETPSEPAAKRHNLGARLFAAMGFGFVGAKISYLGMVPDSYLMFHNESHRWQKFKNVASRLSPLNMFETGPKKIDPRTWFLESCRVMKFTTATFAIGTGAGLVIGFIRGDRIDDWKDFFTHPWQSTKIVLGIEEPPMKEPAPTPLPTTDEIATIKKWTAKHEPRNPTITRAPATSHAEALAQQATTSVTHL